MQPAPLTQTYDLMREREFIPHKKLNTSTKTTYIHKTFSSPRISTRPDTKSQKNLRTTIQSIPQSIPPKNKIQQQNKTSTIINYLPQVPPNESNKMMDDSEFDSALIEHEEHNSQDRGTQNPNVVLTPAMLSASGDLPRNFFSNPETINTNLKINDDITGKYNIIQKNDWRNKVLKTAIPFFLNSSQDKHTDEIDAQLKQLIEKEELGSRFIVVLLDAPKLINLVINAAEQIAPIIRDRCKAKTFINRVFIFFQTQEGKVDFLEQYNPKSGFGTIEYKDPKHNPSEEEINTCIIYALNGIPPNTLNNDIANQMCEYGAANTIFNERNPSFIRVAFNFKERAASFEERAGRGEIKVNGVPITVRHLAWGEEKACTLWLGFVKSEHAGKQQFWELLLKSHKITGITRITPAINQETNAPLGFAFISFENHVAMEKAYWKPIFYNSTQLTFEPPKKPAESTVCNISILYNTTSRHNSKTELTHNNTSLHYPIHIYDPNLTTPQRIKRKQAHDKETEIRKRQFSNPILVALPKAPSKPAAKTTNGDKPAATKATTTTTTTK